MVERQDIRQNDAREQGFTLVEITLSTVFVGFIITILAATTTNIIQSYNKAIWLSQINQAGQQLNADIGDQARYSTAAKVAYKDQGDASKKRVARLCVGGVSYIWNTQAEIDAGSSMIGKNTYDNGKPVSLVRIEDPNAEYCANTSKTVPTSGEAASKVRTLLSRGAAIQVFSVTQGVGNSTNIPLLQVQTVISTEGGNRPILSYTGSDGKAVIEPDQSKKTNAGSTWQCGEWIDNGDGKPGEGDTFEPNRNQYCAFAQYDITVYERSRQR